MDQLIIQFQIEQTDMVVRPRFNIAPTQQIAAVRTAGKKRQRHLVMFRWGLIPFWAKDSTIGSRMINARGETVATKPSFRLAFRQRRCLILSDGYYEWRSIERTKTKQPYFICLKSESPFAMAGIWEEWKDSQGAAIETCSIITTRANNLTQSIHDRMPVILDPASYGRWLDSPTDHSAALESLLCPHRSSDMMASPVSTFVNCPRNDTVGCVTPIDRNVICEE